MIKEDVCVCVCVCVCAQVACLWRRIVCECVRSGVRSYIIIHAIKKPQTLFIETM